MKKPTIDEMIEELDKYYEGHIDIMHYYKSYWEIESFDDEIGKIRDSSFRAVVEKAYELMLKDKDTKNIKQ